SASSSSRLLETNRIGRASKRWPDCRRVIRPPYGHRSRRILSMHYFLAVRQFARTLKQLDHVLDKTIKHAEARKFDVNNFINARLFPDMLPFVAQVRIACDNAKAAAALLSGKEAPKHEDNETTFAELRARIGKCLAYLDTFTAADFARTTSE